MASTPRANIADNVIQDLSCAICGHDALHVEHVEQLPDYVECRECKSAFIMEEGGDRILYGQIADGYPQTSRFALKQWAWIEAVATRANEERPRPVEDPAPEIATPPVEETPAPIAGDQELQESIDMEPADEAWEIFAEPEPEAIQETDERDQITEEPGSEDFQDPIDLQQLEDFSEELLDEADLFEGPDDVQPDKDTEPELQDVQEADLTPAVESEIEASDDIPGFDWLGGLADDETPIEQPDAPLITGAASEHEPADALEPVEAGLSADDLDDLFNVESEQEDIAAPESTAEQLTEQDLLEEESDWLSGEPDLLDESPADDQLDSSWLDDIEVEEEHVETPSSKSAQESYPAEEISAEEQSTRQEVETPVESSLAGEQLADERQTEESLENQSLEPEPALSGLDLPAAGLSIDDEQPADDFLSSLRDSAAIPLESQPLEDTALETSDQLQEEPAPPSWALDDDQEDLGAMAARMEAVTSAEDPVSDVVVPEQFEQDEEQSGEEDAAREDVIHYRQTDPPAGYRHRVVISGDRIIFPGGECVHCARTPVKGQLAIAGDLPEGQGMGDRKPTRFQVPLCGECRDRATSLSEDAKSARLQSLMFALIIGLAFLVGGLAFGLVNPGDMQLADWLTLLIMFIIGFAGSALLLLSRVGNYPPPLDAAYVRTTLLIPSETQGLETAFEWRNADYAQRFHEANGAHALGNVTRVKDRLKLGES